MRYEEWVEELSDRLGGFGANVAVLRQVDSTNRFARHAVTELLSVSDRVPLTFVVAWEQTNGRGRHGRFWLSPAGRGIYASVALAVSSVAEARLLPLVLGVGLAECLNSWLDGDCRLKWPNDLMAKGRKLGGILVEARSREGSVSEAVAGFGINVETLSRTAGLPIATSLRERAAEAPGLPEVTVALLSSVAEALSLLSRPHEVVSRYRALCAHEEGSSIRWRGGQGAIEGRFLGITSAGALRLETGDGTEMIVNAGEVVPS